MRRLRVLGPLEVDGTDQALGPRDRVVVSALALRPGERVDAEVLAEALWGEHPPASSAKVVQGCVSRLRQALGAEAIETVDGGYRLRADHLFVDRQEFEDLVDRARQHLAYRLPQRAIPLLSEALALWRGQAFGALEEWLPGRLEAVRLGQLRLAAEEDLLQARLDAGDHQGVAADATVLTGQQPFRERRWALLALAQYRSGRQADALASIRAARRALGQELGLTPGSELVLLESRILAQDPGLAADHEARLADQACPWKGLAAYDDHDAATFFGREADIAACLAKLGESPLLVVTGPSGSGKSSLVGAGLVPALRRVGWRVEVMTPGADGAQAMAAARQLSASDPLLVVDQFEETFTQRDEGFARPWLAELARYAQESGPVVLVVRGDHVAALGADPALARLTERGLHLVAPLTDSALREVVEGPAEVAGLLLEPGLVDLLVRDAEGQPGALPLLSHALTETWLRREAGLLTVDGYRAAGGIRDAVAASAERLYQGLTGPEQIQVRWLMLRLVSLSESGEPFRTPLPATVAAGVNAVRLRLLDLLVRGRLVTSHAAGYDLAHEALARAWPRLRAWLDEDRAGQQIRRHLSMTAAGWEALGRPDQELYRGARLAAVLDWLERGEEPLPESERVFVDASRAVADKQVRRLAADARRQRAQNRRLRGLVAVAVVLLLMTTVAGGVALDRGHQAASGRDAANQAAREARHEALVARSLSLRTSNRAVAAMLAVLAWREQPDSLAGSAMLSNLTASPGFLGYRPTFLDSPLAAAAIPDRDRVLVASGNAVSLLDPETGAQSRTFGRSGPDRSGPSSLRVSADGSRAVQLLTSAFDVSCRSTCRSVGVVDLAAHRFVGKAWKVPPDTSDVAISADASLVSTVRDDARGRWDVATWDAATGRRLATARLGGTAVAFGTGRLMYLGGRGGRLREVSARTLRVRRSWSVPPRSADRRIIVEGGRLVAAGTRGQLALDLRGRHRPWAVTDHGRMGQGGCRSLAVSAATARVYCGSEAGPVEERDLDTGELTGRALDSQLGGGGDLVVERRADGAAVLLQLGGVQSWYARWRLDGPGVGAHLLAPNAVSSAGYDPTGRLALVTRGGSTKVVDARGRTRLVLPVSGHAVWLSSSAVGLAGAEPAVVQVPSGRVVPIRLGDVDRVFRATGGRGWAVSEHHGAVLVRGFSLTTGKQEGFELGPFEGVADAQVVSDGSRVLVTSRNVYFPELGWGTDEYDATTGEHVSVGLRGMLRIALAPDGTILGADQAGEVGIFSDAFTTTPVVTFPRVSGEASSVQVSRDGELALVTSHDQTVNLFDWATRERWGDPIATEAPVGVVEGWLRPDGEAVLTNTRIGVVSWELRPRQMAAALCALAGRNPDLQEWSSYVGDTTPYAELCPGWPTAQEQVDQTY